MKKSSVSIAFVFSVFVVFLSCTSIPGVKKYPPKSASEATITETPLLVETNWLAEKRNDSMLRIIDFGREPGDYDKGHIPGAVFLDRKVAWDKVNGIPGMLPSVETMTAGLEHAGVSNTSVVVIYDGNSGLWASRLFWALDYLGHRNIHILNGGWEKWVREKHSVQVESSIPPRGTFTPRVQDDLLATQDWIAGTLGNPDVQIIDSRSQKEYSGQDVRSARGGHIPGAVNINWITNLTGSDSKMFFQVETLMDVYHSKNISNDKIVVAYCQTGVRGAHTYFVLKLLGYSKIRVYDGSWAEWGNDWETPIMQPSSKPN